MLYVFAIIGFLVLLLLAANGLAFLVLGIYGLFKENRELEERIKRGFKK